MPSLPRIQPRIGAWVSLFFWVKLDIEFVGLELQSFVINTCSIFASYIPVVECNVQFWMTEIIRVGWWWCGWKCMRRVWRQRRCWQRRTTSFESNFERCWTRFKLFQVPRDGGLVDGFVKSRLEPFGKFPLWLRKTSKWAYILATTCTRILVTNLLELRVLWCVKIQLVLFTRRCFLVLPFLWRSRTLRVGHIHIHVSRQKTVKMNQLKECSRLAQVILPGETWSTGLRKSWGYARLYRRGGYTPGYVCLLVRHNYARSQIWFQVPAPAVFCIKNWSRCFMLCIILIQAACIMRFFPKGGDCYACNLAPGLFFWFMPFFFFASLLTRKSRQDINNE